MLPQPLGLGPVHGMRSYTEMPVSHMRLALEKCSGQLVGVAQLASRMPDAYFPMMKPFGAHVLPGSYDDCEVDPALQGCTRNARTDSVQPGDTTSAHCAYAVRYEFPWFPLLAGASTAPEIRESLASAICTLVKQGFPMSRRWWFAYELFFDRLPLDDLEAHEPVPFLPPDRFFCAVGKLSTRHGVLDNLLGGKDFCPFVEKFAGAEEASEHFRSEFLEVLSPICMKTVREFLHEAELDRGGPVDHVQLERLLKQLADGGFSMNESEKAEFYEALGLGIGVPAKDRLTSDDMVEFAEWLRGRSKLASRLREHLLGVTPTDLRWHAPGEVFLDRLSRVISSIETRASQMIENELPPERKERYFVDAISKPWDRDAVVIDEQLITQLQHGLLSAERYQKVCETQVPGAPLRLTQNWVSSEEYDDMVGKKKVLHYLPPPPEVVKPLLDGYFACVKRMLDDPNMDPIVCATVAKIAFNTLHPMVDGNGRVQRMLFQLILFKFSFLPKLNVPVSVVMLQDRTAYEVLQQKHVDQVMAGVAHHMVKVELEGDTFQHVNVKSGVVALYQYQDFTFAVSSMIKLMHSTLPVLAAKAYFLRRFDWRVDELLKNDALLPARAATKIAKAFKNDWNKDGLSWRKLLRLLFLDGWWIGLKRITHFLRVARHPKEAWGFQDIPKSLRQRFSRSRRKHWLLSSGQLSASSSMTGRVRWVAMSLEKGAESEVALQRALVHSYAGDTVIAVHYPMVVEALLSDDLVYELKGDLVSNVARLRKQLLAKVQPVVDQYKKDGVNFQAYVGEGSMYKAGYMLCEDLNHSDQKPFRIYMGYDSTDHHHRFTDYVVQNAQCNIAIIKHNQYPKSGMTRWAGISSRNLAASTSALKAAFEHSKSGDTVVAVHYPANPFIEEGLSSVYEAHYSSLCGANLDIIMDSMEARILETVHRLAETHSKPGVTFKAFMGEHAREPHRALVRDAAMGVMHSGIPKPLTVYVGYSRRADRTRLVDPNKLHDVAEYIVRHTPCNVVVIKDAGPSRT